MTNKLVVIINSHKVPKLKKILLYEMKFLVPNYSCLRNPWLGGYRPQIPVLSVLCPQLNLLNPPPTEQNFWVGHWFLLPSRCSYGRGLLAAGWYSVRDTSVTNFGFIGFCKSPMKGLQNTPSFVPRSPTHYNEDGVLRTLSGHDLH